LEVWFNENCQTSDLQTSWNSLASTNRLGKKQKGEVEARARKGKNKKWKEWEGWRGEAGTKKERKKRIIGKTYEINPTGFSVRSFNFSWQVELPEQLQLVNSRRSRSTPNLPKLGD
jgi:hypothetical protein